MISERSGGCRESHCGICTQRSQLRSTADRDSPLIPSDLAIVCLWAVFGLSLTAAALVLRFADFGELLTLAG